METQETKDCLLNEFNEQEKTLILPVIIIVGFVCVFGSLGNGLSFIVYATKFERSNSRCFFMFLSAIEFVASSVIMPLDIYRLVNQYTFYSESLCNTFIFFNISLVEASCFTLLVIAVERYRKVCHPFQWQMTIMASQVLCLLMLPLGLVVAIPSVFIFGSQPVNSSVYIYHPERCIRNLTQFGGFTWTNITLYKCTVNTAYKGGQIAKSYAGYFTVSTNVLLVGIVICYWKIVKMLKAHDSLRRTKFQKYDKTEMKRNLIRKRDDLEDSVLVSKSDDHINISLSCSRNHADPVECFISTTAEDVTRHVFLKNNLTDATCNNTSLQDFKIKKHWSKSADTLNSQSNASHGPSSMHRFCHRPDLVDSPLVFGHSLPSIPVAVASEDRTQIISTICAHGNRECKTKQKDSLSRRVTRIMLIITTSSFLCAAPYLVLSLVRSGDRLYEIRLSELQRVLYHLFLRSYFAKSAINPIVYGMVDSRFRNAILKMIRKTS